MVRTFQRNATREWQAAVDGVMATEGVRQIANHLNGTALGIMRKHRALEDTVERARHYGAMARDALGLFRDSPLKAALLEAVDFAIDRAH